MSCGRSCIEDVVGEFGRKAGQSPVNLDFWIVFLQNISPEVSLYFFLSCDDESKYVVGLL